MSKKTLLEKAKSYKVAKRERDNDFNVEEIDLAVAWANNEIAISSVAHALGLVKSHRASVYVFLARALRQHLLNHK